MLDRPGVASSPCPFLVLLAIVVAASVTCAPVDHRQGSTSTSPSPGGAAETARRELSPFDGTIHVWLTQGDEELFGGTVRPASIGETSVPEAIDGSDEAVLARVELADGIELIAWRALAPASSLHAGRIGLEIDRDIGTAPLDLRLDLAPQGYAEHAYPARVSPTSPDVVLLHTGESSRRADALLDLATRRQFHVSEVAGLLEGSAHRAASVVGGTPSTGARLRLEGRLVAEGDVELLEWREEQLTSLPQLPIAHIDSASASAAARPAPDITWEVAAADAKLDEASLFEAVAALNELTPPGLRAVFELPPAWQKAVRRDRERALAYPEGFSRTVATISARGFAPVLSLSPFGTSDASLVAERPDAFLRTGSGEPVRAAGALAVGESVLGRFIFDPTSESGRRGIRESVESVLRDGAGPARGLRISHLDELWNVYRDHAARFALSGRTGSASRPQPVALAALGAALRAVRQAAGPRRWLLGDWNTPVEAYPHLDRSRPTPDELDGGDLLVREARDALRSLLWHHRTTVCEGYHHAPDSTEHPGGLTSPGAFRAFLDLRCILGRPASLAWPRAGSTDPDLLRSRLASIAQSLPPVKARALQGREAAGALPRIWVLETEAFDTLAIFNWDVARPQRVRVRAADLELPRAGDEGRAPEYLVFDRHARRIVGRFRKELDVNLPARSSRLLSLHGSGKQAALVATSRHRIHREPTRSRWLPDARALEVSVAPSAARHREPLRLDITLPAKVDVDIQTDPADAARSRWRRQGRHLIVELDELESFPFRLTVRCREDAGEAPPASWNVANLEARHVAAARGVWLQWDVPSSTVGAQLEGYEIRRDGGVVARTFDHRFFHELDRPPPPGATWVYEVRARPSGAQPVGAWSRGVVEAVTPPELELADLPFASVQPRQATVTRDLGVTGRRLDGGGLGMIARCRVELALHRRFTRLAARVGVDPDAALWTRLRFRVEVDGELVRETDPIPYGAPAVPLEIDLKGAERLVLEVIEASESGERHAAPRGLAVWERAVLTTTEAPEAPSGKPPDRPR